MGCDGIWEVKSNNEMVAWIKTRLEDKMPVGKIIEDLLDELVAKDSANSEYGMDNMSAVLIKFDKSKK
jgi:serine/threonine protein phosphatase PrpC